MIKKNSLGDKRVFLLYYVKNLPLKINNNTFGLLSKNVKSRFFMR